MISNYLAGFSDNIATAFPIGTSKVFIRVWNVWSRVLQLPAKVFVPTTDRVQPLAHTCTETTTTTTTTTTKDLNNFQNGQISYWSVGTSSLSNNQVSHVEIHLVTVCCVNSNVNTYFLHFEILILNTFYLLCQISSLFTYIHTTRYKIYYIKLNLLFEMMRRFVNNTHWVKIVQTSDHIHMNLCNVSNKFII